jgi:hypothetical protein
MQGNIRWCSEQRWTLTKPQSKLSSGPGIRQNPQIICLNKKSFQLIGSFSCLSCVVFAKTFSFFRFLLFPFLLSPFLCSSFPFLFFLFSSLPALSFVDPFFLFLLNLPLYHFFSFLLIFLFFLYFFFLFFLLFGSVSDRIRCICN